MCVCVCVIVYAFAVCKEVEANDIMQHFQDVIQEIFNHLLFFHVYVFALLRVYVFALLRVCVRVCASLCVRLCV